TSMPWKLNRWSVFSSYLASRSSLFWKPLHPPPCTRTRRYSLVPASTSPLPFMSAMCRFTSVAAFSVTVIGGAAGGASLTPRFWVSGATAVDMSLPFDQFGVRVGGSEELYRRGLGPFGRLGFLLGVALLLVVLDRRLDGVLGQDRAVNLDRRQRQF